MGDYTYVSRIDELRRIIFPREVVKMLDIREGELFEVKVDLEKQEIILKRCNIKGVGIEGVIEFGGNVVSQMEFLEKFYDWLEENGWTFGGGTEEIEVEKK